MKYKLALVMSAFCAFSVWTEAKVKLPAILSDGMVLQRERSVKICLLYTSPSPRD